MERELLSGPLVGASSERMHVGEVTLHFVAAGSGQPVVLLHGFPEFWYSWRRQIPALAEAGFRAVAPDLRGYNYSDRPAAVSSYRVPKLIEDLANLIRRLAPGPVCVVGHDWGGILAWRLASLHPDLVRKLAILNAPHPSVFLRELMHNPLQWIRSSYAMFFQLPWLPERALRANDWAFLDSTFRSQPVHSEAFSEADIAAYKRALEGPGGLSGPLNYYRAAARHPRELNYEPRRSRVPTLLMWGEQDPFLSVRMTEGLEPWVPELEVLRIADSSHWVQNDVPDRVNQALVKFFSHGS